MSPMHRPLSATLLAAAVVFSAFVPRPGLAGSAAEIDRDSTQALATLESHSSEAKALAARAKGILVFPKIIKGGLIIGAQAGEGALRVNGKTAGYYNTVALSYGLQAGVQWFGYAMYFMNDPALKYLDKSDGWEIGTGPSIVVIDKGAAGGFTTTSAKDDIYVFFFEQEGLMAGLGLQGTKITKIKPD
ncbi:MAG: YSC84-related protein [Rhodospirillales bacterium]|nr:YSC84-related protein [Rhodospirillales bacterium]MDH3967116.1 YSC84-related protein [Rhodospirillales bacterium]